MNYKALASCVIPSLTICIVALLGNLLLMGAETTVSLAAPGSTASQAASSQDPGVPNVLSKLNTWVQWMGAIVAVLSFLCVLLLGYNFAASLLHYRQAAKQVEDAELRVDHKLLTFERTHEIAKLETPDKILDAMRRELEPRIESVRFGLQKHDEHFALKIQELAEHVQSLKDQLGSRPTIDQITVEMNRKYRPPQDLQQRLLGRVFDAFLQVKTLSREEVESVRAILRADGQEAQACDPTRLAPS